MIDIFSLSVEEMASKIKEGHLSSVEVCEKYIERISKFEKDIKAWGQKIAKIAKSLGMVIHYHNRSKLKDEKEDGAIYHDNIKSLFSVSDVLSICCPATKETENMINKETVEYFPKGAVITNVARGDIVDDEALIDSF